MNDLIEAFEKAGLSVSPSWVYRQEKKKKLSLPRSTTNVKRPIGTREGAVRMFTKAQIHEIVVAFLPGGSGEWHYKKGGKK